MKAEIPDAESVSAYFSYLEGDSYEVGRIQGEEIKSFPWAERWVSSHPMEPIRFKQSITVLEEYCPGLQEELQAVADSLNVECRSLKFFDENFLESGGCSLAAILPSKSTDRKTYLLRNYDLTPEISDMRLCSTRVRRKYSHSGFSVSFFGRSEGINERGLAVAFASCGIPVGAHPGMKRPVVRGLQFGIIVRALLENCKDVEEAILYLRDMPIGANMNLLMADRQGHAALFETYDGRRAMKRADRETGYITATNHALLPGIQDDGTLRQSKVRYDKMNQMLGGNHTVSKKELRDLTLKEFPDGITVHNYRQNFGTVHSLLLNLQDGELEFTFGSPLYNELHRLKTGGKFPYREVKVLLPEGEYGPDFWAVMEE